MNRIFHTTLTRFITRLFFRRLTIIHGERLPKTGPVLYLGLHRNGAVDGLAYGYFLSQAVFMVARQLHKNFLGRLLFPGIEVVRQGDEGNNVGNTGALAECLRVLGDGGEIFIFPEGTSSLGCRHLPFKSGAARLLLAALKQGVAAQVVPLAVVYSEPRAFRGEVEVAVGEPFHIEDIAPSDVAGLRLIKQRLTRSLEDTGINVETAEYQDTIQSIAFLGTLSGRSYYEILKTLETGIPHKLMQAWRDTLVMADQHKLLMYRGVPLYPQGARLAALLKLLILAPLVMLLFALNLPPLLGGYIAGERMPDDINVVALWKILVGAPVFLLWSLTLTIAALAFGKPLFLIVYFLCTVCGLVGYPHLKRLYVETVNGFRCPQLKGQMLKLMELHSKERSG